MVDKPTGISPAVEEIRGYNTLKNSEGSVCLI